MQSSCTSFNVRYRSCIMTCRSCSRRLSRSSGRSSRSGPRIKAHSERPSAVVDYDSTCTLTFFSQPFFLVDKFVATEVVEGSCLRYFISPAQFAKSTEDPGICVSRFQKRRKTARRTHRFSDGGLCAFPPPSSLLSHTPKSPKLRRAVYCEILPIAP